MICRNSFVLQQPSNTAVDICATIKGVDMDVRRVPGTALANDRTSAIVYTPPEGEALLRDLLADWERWLHEFGEIDPLIALAVQHYQFEAIHPFTDGNGRTGRVLNLLFLVERGFSTSRCCISAARSSGAKPITIACCLT